ncbi:MAG: dUTP diphosphatase [Gammaproteobacteria bacterium]|nr:dUTP diphosphatase [Gammaproteobacteria bacterium]
MLALQDEMNRRVDADWLDRGREWYRAIWIECAELMDHYGGWKWWKHSGPADVEQVLLEIVDIWHFGLSLRIRKGESLDVPAGAIARAWLAPWPSRGFLRDVEELARAALHEQAFAVSVVPTLLAGIGRDFDDLYRAYVGKNVLNVFRQDHGYREGHYRKLWQGREDNAHLAEILGSLDVDSAHLRDDVYAALQARYGAA